MKVNSYHYLFFLALLGFVSCKKEEEQLQPIVAVEVVTPQVLLNGIPITLPESKGEVEDQLVMIPAQDILTQLGFTCTFSTRDSALICTKGNNSFIFTMGESEAILNQRSFYQLQKPYFSNNRLLVESRFLRELSNLRVEWDVETRSLQIYDYDQLDYGLYFYDTEEGTWGDWDVPGCQKFIEGVDNPYFDPSKPTMIWVHGWQSGSVGSKFRPDYHLNSGGVDRYVHTKWKEAGWNVAIFHWEQIADETLPYDAESKINASILNSVGMRWKKSDGNYALTGDPQDCIAELFAQAYEAVARTQQHPEIRLSGNSFGSQVVLHGTERVYLRNSARLPSRIALLDMAWTSNYVDAQALYTTEITERAVTALSPRCLIEYYRSSILTSPFAPDALVRQAAVQEMTFDYAGSWNVPLKHTVITHHYFWSFEQNSPAAINDQQQSVGIALSASTPKDSLRQMMGQQYHWEQIEGGDTYSPFDDVFERQDGPT